MFPTIALAAMQFENVARQIERAANEHAFRTARCCSRLQKRVPNAARHRCLEAFVRSNLHQRRGRECVRLAGYRDGVNTVDEPLEWSNDGLRVLRLHHPPDEVDRARLLLAHFGQRAGNCLSAAGVMSPVQPDLASFANVIVERAWGQAFEPCGPYGLRQSALECLIGRLAPEHDVRGGDGCASVINLVSAVKTRQRKFDLLRRRLKNQLPAALERIEVAPEDMQRGTNLSGAGFEDL